MTISAPVVGGVLTSTTGSWTNGPTGYLYQWQRSTSSTTGFVNISGATSSTYTIQYADNTYYIRCNVEAVNAIGVSPYISSNVSGQVGPQNLIKGIAASNIQNNSPPTTDVNQISTLGATYLRFDINFGQIGQTGSSAAPPVDSVASNWNWAPTDAVVSAATAKGISVLGILNYTPNWLRSNTGNPADYPGGYTNGLNYFTQFCQIAVTRYAAMGVHMYEIWNEPNQSGGMTVPSAANFTTLVQACYPVIKASDPQAIVISGGLAPVGVSSGGNYTALDFLTSMYSAGVHGYFDLLGHHPYSQGDMPGASTSTQDAWAQMSLSTPNLRSIMTSNGDSVKQIIATETGAFTAGSGAFTQSQQATYISDLFTVGTTYSWLAGIFVYRHKDTDTTVPATTPFGSYGLLNYDGTTKSAASSYTSASVSR
jgi:hypothetical protein